MVQHHQTSSPIQSIYPFINQSNQPTILKNWLLVAKFQGRFYALDLYEVVCVVWYPKAAVYWHLITLPPLVVSRIWRKYMGLYIIPLCADWFKAYIDGILIGSSNYIQVALWCLRGKLFFL